MHRIPPSGGASLRVVSYHREDLGALAYFSCFSNLLTLAFSIVSLIVQERAHAAGFQLTWAANSPDESGFNIELQDGNNRSIRAHRNSRHKCYIVYGF
jgi:hypothetical protein